jgi:hypothetical protein
MAPGHVVGPESNSLEVGVHMDFGVHVACPAAGCYSHSSKVLDRQVN